MGWILKTKGEKMTKEKIEQKIKEYKQQQQQLKNNLLAYDGAIQALEQLLTDESEEVSKKPQKV